MELESSHPSTARRVLKLSLLLLLVTSVLAVWLTARVRALIGERALAFGPQLERYVALLGHVTSVELNGQVLHLSTSVIDDAPGAVLARFSDLCTRESPEWASDLLRAQAAHGATQRPFVGVAEQRLGDAAAAAACLAQPGSASLDARIANFARIGDVSAIGQLRYLFARKLEHGGTHVLFVWNAGPLKLAAMFPDRGDAAGADLPGVPRPEHARRMLSAQALGKRFGLVAYAVPDAVEPAFAAYAQRLERAGFRSLRVLAPEAAAAVAPDVSARAFVRDGEPLLVQGFRQDAETRLSVVRLGGPVSLQAAATP